MILNSQSWQRYCTILFNLSATVTCDAPDKNIVSGDAQSLVTPRPHYMSHSLIGHRYWDITISQRLHGFSPFFLQIRIYLMHGIHKINNLQCKMP